MKILVLGRGLPGPGQPLLGIFEYQQARALAAAGHEVVYGALDIRFLHHWRPWGIRHSELDGVHVVELSLPLGRLQYRGDYRLVRAFWELLYRACVRAHGRPDVVHSHFIGWSAAAALAKRHYRYPLVVTEHTSALMARDVPPRMLRGIEIAYAGADVLIAVSPGLQRRMRELTGREAQYVPNLVEAAVFAGARPAPRRRHRVVTVGNLIARKRIDVLLDACAECVRAGRPDPRDPRDPRDLPDLPERSEPPERPERPDLSEPSERSEPRERSAPPERSERPDLSDLSLVVIGGGPELPALRARAAELGLSGRVDFLGPLPQVRVADHLAGADVFALASSEETFGVVLIEAMAAGVPVVSTRSGGPEGFVTEGTGVLTGMSAADIAAGLREAFGRAWDREAIRAYAVRHHSPRVVAARLTELYGVAVARSVR